MSIQSLIRWTARVAASVAVVLVVAVATAVAIETWTNGYAALDYDRTPLFLAEGFFARFTLPVLALTLLAWLAGGVLHARRGGGARAAAAGLATSAGLLLLLRVAYVYNRYHADVNWSWRREWHGVSVPGFLWEYGLLLRNAAIVLGSLVAAWLAYRLLWFLLRRIRLRPFPALYVGGIVALLCLTIATALTVRARGDAQGPNFIVVCLDTLRADHLGAYGYGRPTSPTIDSLATESTLFEWAISQAEATLPSHMSLFTSETPSTHGVWNHYHALGARSLTLAEAFREAGYRTAAFVDAGHLLGLFGFRQGFDRYHDRYKRLAGSAQMGLKWLDERPDGAPFFLFVHGYDIHTPYAPWSPYRKAFTDSAYAGGFEPTVAAMRDIGWRARTEPDYEVPWTDADRRYVVGCYDAAIRATDDVVRAFLDALAERGLLHDTWLVVLSDHGEEFLEHGSVEHDKLYLPVTRVPLLVRPPDGMTNAPRGLRVSDAVGLIDVFPTLLALAGIDVPNHVEGRSLVPALRGEPLDEALTFSQNWRFGHQRALTGAAFRILSSAERPDSIEVYRYREDPLEQNPIYVTGRTTGREAAFDGPARALSNTMRTWIEATSVEGHEAKRIMGSDFETLRNLGYIQ